jgi:hypothetical protein
LAHEHGVKAAAEVAAFEAKHVSHLKDFVEKQRIDCDYYVTKAIDVQLSHDHSVRLKDGYQKLIDNGCEPTSKATYIDKEESEKVIPSRVIIELITNCWSDFWGQRCSRLLHI